MDFVLTILAILGLKLNNCILQMNGTTFLKELGGVRLLRMQNFKKILVTLWNFVFGCLIEGRLWLEQVINSWQILFVWVYVSTWHACCVNSVFPVVLVSSLNTVLMFLQFLPLWICSAWYDVLQESFDAAKLYGEQITGR